MNSIYENENPFARTGARTTGVFVISCSTIDNEISSPVERALTRTIHPVHLIDFDPDTPPRYEEICEAPPKYCDNTMRFQ
jgi:hypothetical protein